MTPKFIVNEPQHWPLTYRSLFDFVIDFVIPMSIKFFLFHSTLILKIIDREIVILDLCYSSLDSLFSYRLNLLENVPLAHNFYTDWHFWFPSFMPQQRRLSKQAAAHSRPTFWVRIEFAFIDFVWFYFVLRLYYRFN